MHMNYTYSCRPKFFIASAATVMITIASYSQNTDALFQRGLSYEKTFHDRDALNQFEEILRCDTMHVPALTHASRMLANIAGRQRDEAAKKELASRARSLALRAIDIDHNNKEAHVNHVIALALLAEVASGAKEKIQYARTIKQEADILLDINPAYAPGLYILGKWHLTLSTLSPLEKIGCTILFNDLLKDASLKQALVCFDRAIKLEPEYILFHYNRALAQYYSGNIVEARHSLNCALALTQKEPDDAIRIQKCQSLLKKINNAE